MELGCCWYGAGNGAQMALKLGLCWGAGLLRPLLPGSSSSQVRIQPNGWQDCWKLRITCFNLQFKQLFLLTDAADGRKMEEKEGIVLSHMPGTSKWTNRDK